MTLLTNSFEGITPSGTVPTVGNSGGASGNAFDVVFNTSSTVASDSAHAAHGGLGLQLATAGTAANYFVQWSTSMGSLTQVWFRFYVYMTANTATELRWFEADPAAGAGGIIKFTTAGKVAFADSASTDQITSTASLTLNAWNRIEGFVLASATVGQLEFKLFLGANSDGTVPDETKTSAASLNTSAGPLTRYIYGNNGTAAASFGPAWLDDLGLSSTGYVGPAATIPRGAQGYAQPGRTWRRRFHHRQVPQQPQAAAAPFTIVQAAPTVTATATSATVTLAQPTGTGNTLVACVTADMTTTSPVVSGITLGGAADNWQAAVSNAGTGRPGSGAVWFDPGAAAGQTSVVVSLTGGTGTGEELYVAVYEVAGALAVDKTSSATVPSGSPTTTWSSGATATTTAANEIFFGAATGTTSVPAVTGAGTWTTQSNGTGGQDQVSGYQIVSVTGTATFSGTQSSGGYTAVVATFSAGAGGINVNAGLATGTGAAFGEDNDGGIAVAAEGANAVLATGTGTPPPPAAATGANAVLAHGTGAAQPPAAAAGINAAAATGTGAAQPPVPAVAVNAGLATGVGAAQQPTISTVPAVSPGAGLATGTGTAQSPVPAIGANAATATGIGTAQPPSASAGISAAVAHGTGTAQSPLPAAGANTAVATGAAAAQPPVPAIAVGAGLAAGIGTAQQPTVSTSGGINVNAGLAAGTGTAQSPAAAAGGNAAAATGTGAALPPIPARTPVLATGTGAARAPALAAAANAQAATALAAALSPAVSIGLAFTVGALTAATAATATLAPADKAASALTAATAPSSTITAGDTRTGGPG